MRTHTSKWLSSLRFFSSPLSRSKSTVPCPLIPLITYIRVNAVSVMADGAQTPLSGTLSWALGCCFFMAISWWGLAPGDCLSSVSDVSLVERFPLLLCDWLFVPLGVSVTTRAPSIWRLCRFRRPSGRRQVLNALLWPFLTHPLIVSQWDKFWLLTSGPPGVARPTKKKRPHAAVVHAGIMLARVALNSSLPTQLAMLFEARAACLRFGTGERGEKGRGWGSWSEQAAHCVKKRLEVLLYF